MQHVPEDQMAPEKSRLLLFIFHLHNFSLELDSEQRFW